MQSPAPRALSTWQSHRPLPRTATSTTMHHTGRKLDLICASTASSRSFTLSKSSWRALPCSGAPSVARYVATMPCGQVAVDVRVHPRQRELDGGMPRRAAALEQRPPCRGRPRRVGVSGRDRIEIQVRKHDVERREERRIPKRRCRHRIAHRKGHLQVQPVEPLQRRRRRARLRSSAVMMSTTSSTVVARRPATSSASMAGPLRIFSPFALPLRDRRRAKSRDSSRTGRRTARQFREASSSRSAAAASPRRCRSLVFQQHEGRVIQDGRPSLWRVHPAVMILEVVDQPPDVLLQRAGEERGVHLQLGLPDHRPEIGWGGRAWLAERSRAFPRSSGAVVPCRLRAQAARRSGSSRDSTGLPFRARWSARAICSAAS